MTPSPLLLVSVYVNLLVSICLFPTTNAWSEAAQKVLLAQPSSAAAEQLMNNSFGDQQLSSLEDYIETALMLQHNRH